jgi:phage shock protein C
MYNRLYRSETNKVIGGVCGGLGEYLQLDPVLIRILAVLACLAWGSGILIYLLAWLIIPTRPVDAPPPDPNYKKSTWSKYIPGIILIAVGVVWLMQAYSYYIDWTIFWSIVIILIGLGMIFFKGSRSATPPGPNEQSINNDSGGPIS